MAGLMSRASLVVKSKFSKLLDRAENPTETLDYSYEKQLELLQNVKRGVADVVTSKKRLQMQTDKLEQNVVTLEQQARQALALDYAHERLERRTAVHEEGLARVLVPREIGVREPVGVHAPLDQHRR